MDNIWTFGKEVYVDSVKNEEEESTTGLLDTPLVMDLEADNSDVLWYIARSPSTQHVYSLFSKLSIDRESSEVYHSNWYSVGQQTNLGYK